MLIAIIGTRASGRSSVENYLVAKGFTRIRLHLTSSMLDHVTYNWRTHFVTVDLNTRNLVKQFAKRPFFMLISIDAPILTRFERVQKRDLHDLVNLHIANTFSTLADLHRHLDEIDLLAPGHLRPDWDTYFMTIASLASHRSNCMKRRVGAVLVDSQGGNRILATGYNGTARGLTNCNAGGCWRCNTGDIKYDCICLHAEENALLEAGRGRISQGAVLYCNTCPCLKCTVKIIQTGVKTVVYNLSYKVDDESARLFQSAGVELRKYNPHKISTLPATDIVRLRSPVVNGV
ncbi:hypothetical protein FISHEDRAFT_65845 [Fistulina hepatica ATCC 64428]|uniref:Deoxycytidylate deaminase n=1 Tax=Fistulina hepatica ATCC 64428 TaxID=1128425 RepID=A0A0D7ABY5_9AGAR|nr:hypothetical protein FISHEDRAFT_65845 [Fistulina hepatica ATCC 64428]